MCVEHCDLGAYAFVDFSKCVMRVRVQSMFRRLAGVEVVVLVILVNWVEGEACGGEVPVWVLGCRARFQSDDVW